MSGSGVVKVESVEQYIEFYRNAIMEKLGSDRDALKEFEIRRVSQVESGRPGLLRIVGYLALDNSGQKVRAFDVPIEEGLGSAEDAELADSLAYQCYKCVVEMKRDRQQGLDVLRVH